MADKTAKVVWQGDMTFEGLGSTYPDGKVIFESDESVGGHDQGFRPLETMRQVQISDGKERVVIAVSREKGGDDLVGLYHGSIPSDVLSTKLSPGEEGDGKLSTVPLNSQRFSEPIQQWALSPDGARVAAEVGMDGYADRYPAGLSDGMRKRAAIARTLSLSPEAVLFDEPTTGLDPVSARRIDRLIRRLADERQMTAVVVSHDLASIFSIADRIAFVYQGRIHLCGTKEEFLDSEDPIVAQFIAGRSAGPMETPGF